MYHVDHNPPVQGGVDDETGEPLVQRDDDKEETVRKRLSVYHEQTEPLVEYYSKGAENKYSQVDGVGSLDDIKSRMFDALKSH